MPWVRAILRDQKVYARADEKGALVIEGGRVEVRYKPKDGRRYSAAARNLTIDDATPLPDETCAPAESVAKDGAKDGAKDDAKGARAKAPSAGAVTDPKAALASGSIIAYTDGACSGNPGPAGLGVVIIDGPKRIEISEYLGEATNNIAELTAVLRALGELEEGRAALIHTDSQYSIGVLQKGWKAKANTALIADLRASLSAHGRARLVYVPGHAGVLLNERADALAREAIRERKSARRVYESKAPASKAPNDEAEKTA